MLDKQELMCQASKALASLEHQYQEQPTLSMPATCPGDAATWSAEGGGRLLQEDVAGSTGLPRGTNSTVWSCI